MRIQEYTMTYEMLVKDTLKDNHLMRHLFARLNTEVSVQVDEGIKVTGILKTIDLSSHYIEVEAKIPQEKTYFINWRKIAWIETENKVFQPKL